MFRPLPAILKNYLRSLVSIEIIYQAWYSWRSLSNQILFFFHKKCLSVWLTYLKESREMSRMWLILILSCRLKKWETLMFLLFRKSKNWSYLSYENPIDMGFVSKYSFLMDNYISLNQIWILPTSDSFLLIVSHVYFITISSFQWYLFYWLHKNGLSTLKMSKCSSLKH